MSDIAVEFTTNGKTTVLASTLDLDHETSLDKQSENNVSRKRRWYQRSQWSEEKHLLLRLDFFILSWACFGYFLRLLDTTNMTNAYVSGLKEDLKIKSDEYNYFTTYWTVGYTIGMIPSQFVATHVRASVWLPAAEIIWAVLTFSFAAVKSAKQIYAIRFLIGLAESPFYVGVMTLLGNWYTPAELAKRASIFYAASFAASMFSGYLQAALYTGLNGRYGIKGWQWLFIICGIINVVGALWGFFAVPDGPYNTRAFYLTEKQRDLAKSRMTTLGRKPFKGARLSTFVTMFSRPFVWLFVVNYIFFCLDTYPASFFAIYLKSLGEYSVQKVNIIPTGASAVGLVGTLFWGFLSDTLHQRVWIAFAVSLITLISVSTLAAAPSKGGIFFGYIINPSTLAYGPIMITYLNETFSSFPEERALILGVAQAVGAAFNAWVPLLMFNTGTQAPLFKKGYIVVSVMAGLQALGVVGLGYLGKRIRGKDDLQVVDTDDSAVLHSGV